MDIETVFSSRKGMQAWLRAAKAAGIKLKTTRWGTNPLEQNIIVHNRQLYMVTTEQRNGKWGSCARPLPQNAVHPLTIKVAVPLKATAKECISWWLGQTIQVRITPGFLQIKPIANAEELLCHFTWGNEQFVLERRDGIVSARPRKK